MLNFPSYSLQQNRPERVVVIGCCGAGKTTFSAELARHLSAKHIERDRLGELGSAPYRSAVGSLMKEARWVFDGPPYFVEDQVYAAAQTVIWLDYSRICVVGRAIRRAVWRTFALGNTGTSGSGRLAQWIAPGGPLFAWSVYPQRQQEFSQLALHPEFGRKMLRFNDPVTARNWLASLADGKPLS